MFFKKDWVTPLIVGAFLLTAVTGLLMLFHQGGGLTRPLHEWFSMVLVLAVCFHVVIHWKALKHFASQKTGMILIGVFLLLTVLAFLPMGEGSRGGRGHHHDEFGSFSSPSEDNRIPTGNSGQPRPH